MTSMERHGPKITNLQRINCFLRAVYDSYVVGRRVVEECIPVGHLDDRTGVDLKRPLRLDHKKCTDCGNDRFHQRRHMQYQQPITVGRFEHEYIIEIHNSFAEIMIAYFGT